MDTECYIQQARTRRLVEAENVSAGFTLPGCLYVVSAPRGRPFLHFFYPQGLERTKGWSSKWNIPTIPEWMVDERGAIRCDGTEIPYCKWSKRSDE